MAENSTLKDWKTTVPCRFFANGMCREGDRCKYLHEEGLPQLSSVGNKSKTAMKGKVEHSQRIQSTSEIDEGCSGTSTCSNTDSTDGFGSIAIGSSLTPDETNERVAGDLSSGNHMDSRGSQSTSEPVICPYFQQGCCMFGNNCFNRHDKAEDSSRSKSCIVLDEQSAISEVNTSTCPSTSDVDSGSSVSSSTEEKKDKVDEGCSELLAAIQLKTRLRVSAPEFIPSGFTSVPLDSSTEDEVNSSSEASAGKTWAQVVNSSAGNGVPSPFTSLCPYAQAGDCPYAEECTYVHGDTCEFCGNACLHPTNEEQRKSHTDECIKQHEREMELAFAVARSKDKQCGVCFEVVVDKNPASEQRFGILPNCNHCFCLACIRKWRQAKQFENKIIRACPECRVTSDFVCPSMYWVDTKEEKDKLIVAYKDALSNKQCKYFKQGRGKCPFGNKCFYLHAYPDGTKVDTGPPIRRHRQNADGETDILQLFLWDFLDERDNRWLYSLDDLDLMAILSGSDDSDTSDIEMF